jgi:putative oxidoreductase
MRNNTTSDVGKFILRVGVGGLMVFHGIHKLIHGHDFIVKQLEINSLPSFLWIGVPVAEIIAPLLLIFGVATRISSFLIAFTMLMTFFLVLGTTGLGLNPATGGLKGELNLLFLVASVAILFIGPGKIRINKQKRGIWV